MIHTAVIAAAGRGSRFLPLSAFVPKEMLPLGTVPVIQYIVEELLDVGVTKLIVVTDRSKSALISFFDTSYHEAYITFLKDPQLLIRQQQLIERLKKVEVIITYQSGHYGNASPLKAARPYLSMEPFFYTWADDFIQATPSRFSQLAQTYGVYKSPILSGIRAQSDEDYDRYAYVQAQDLHNGSHNLELIAEKPGIKDSPSNLGVLSGHLFDETVLDFFDEAYDKHDPKSGEFLYNTIMHDMIAAGKKVIVKEIENAEYIDIGNVDAYAANYRKFLGLEES